MALIFFDFDGVLVDSLSVETDNFVGACHDVGIDVVNNSDDMATLSEGNFYQGLLELGVEQSNLDKALLIYADKKTKPDFHVDSHAPMIELLKDLAKKNPVYIITSNVSITVERVLSENGVENVLDILGADKEPSKVKKIHKVMQQHPGEKTIFVGDTKGDMVESKEAGVDVRLGVTWGWQKPWVVASGNPDYIFHEFDDIVAWFSGFEQGSK